MSSEIFCQRLRKAQVHPSDLVYMPKWIEEYARGLGKSASETLPVSEELLLVFLRGLRDRHVEAWRRLQACRAIEWYQSLVLKTSDFDFGPFKRKLGEIAERERLVGGEDGGEANPEGVSVPGEGNPGLIDPREPAPIRAMRERMRLLHHPKSTEAAYVGWLARFIRHVDSEHLEKFGEAEIGDFLTDLAVTGEVSAGTQNQALCALLF